MINKQDVIGIERRKFVRVNHDAHLDYKVCKKETIYKLLQGYTSNVSEAGLLCNIKDKVSKNDLLWLSFSRDILEVCETLEKKSLIYQKGIVGRVVRIKHKEDDTYDIGVRFLTREEKDRRVSFLKY